MILPNKLFEINGREYIYFGLAGLLEAIPDDCVVVQRYGEGPVFAQNKAGQIVSGERFALSEIIPTNITELKITEWFEKDRPGFC